MLKGFTTRLLLACGLSAGLALTSCQRESLDTLSGTGVEYFPLQVGKYVVYNVDSTYWNDELEEVIPIRWQIRYDIVDSFRDDNRDMNYTVNVSKRRAYTHDYSPSHTLHYVSYTDRIERKEQSIRSIAFKLPVTEGRSWDPYEYIKANPYMLGKYPEFASENWKSTYRDVNTEYRNDILYFPNSVTLDIIDEEVGNPELDPNAPAHKYYAKEIYAQGIGLAFREYTVWHYDPLPPMGTGKGYRKGISVTMTAVEHN